MPRAEPGLFGEFDCFFLHIRGGFPSLILLWDLDLRARSLSRCCNCCSRISATGVANIDVLEDDLENLGFDIC